MQMWADKSLCTPDGSLCLITTREWLHRAWLVTNILTYMISSGELVWLGEKSTGFATRYIQGCDFGQVSPTLRALPSSFVKWELCPHFAVVSDISNRKMELSKGSPPTHQFFKFQLYESKLLWTLSSLPDWEARTYLQSKLFLHLLHCFSYYNTLPHIALQIQFSGSRKEFENSFHM